MLGLRRKSRRKVNYTVGKPKEEKKITFALIGSILGWIFQIAVVLVFAYVCVYFFGEQIANVGDSMSPTLENEDVVLVDRFRYIVRSPQVGDLIIFRPNGNENSHYYIKRVIATPGDTVQIRDGFLYVNDELQTDFLFGRVQNAGLAEEPVKVEADAYFVMGDNPGSSEDSRYSDIGNVSRGDIEGKAWYLLSPKKRRGKLSFKKE